MNPSIAFDKSTARRIDEQGFLHVDGCNISKACINPYLGSEIPDWQALGLEATKVYQILRPAAELEKAAATFNNLPIMDVHVEVSAFDLENPKIKRHMVGSTGNNSQFQDPYLTNSLAIWTAGAIEGVESKAQTELSCAYRYEIDMSPGELAGVKYDGMMKNLRGNHVAIVVEGRAGPDVIVRDAAMVKPAASPKKVGLAPAIRAFVQDSARAKAQKGAVIKLVSDALAPAKKKLGIPMTKDCIPETVSALAKCKALIESKMKPGVEGNRAKILDDATSAIDSAVHHLLDFQEEKDVNKGSITVEDGERVISALGSTTKQIRKGGPDEHHQAHRISG